MSVERQKRDAVIRLLVAHVGAQAAHVGSLGPDAGPRQRHLVVQHYKVTLILQPYMVLQTQLLKLPG